MMRSQRLELICGVLGGALGLAALGVALFAPLGVRCVDTTVSSSASGCSPVNLIQMQDLASLTFAITLFGGLSLSIILFAVGHSLTHTLPLLIALWVFTMLLWFATLLGALSIGLFFVPADGLALVAAIAGTVFAGQRVPARV
jgi:hypothetical protein